MPNGKYGDHPITDILIYGRRVYSKRTDDLIRKIVALGGAAKSTLCSWWSITIRASRT